jgi:hypothetical protein
MPLIMPFTRVRSGVLTHCKQPVRRTGPVFHSLKAT